MSSGYTKSPSLASPHFFMTRREPRFAARVRAEIFPVPTRSKPCVTRARPPLGGIPLPPERTLHAVAEFLLAGIEAIGPQVKPADEFAAALQLGGPVTEHRRSVVERKPARQDLQLVPLARRGHAVGDVAHHFRVGVEFDQPVDVGLNEPAQPQPGSL
jgi:hypothetical protein